jgi:hypothetical protein
MAADLRSFLEALDDGAEALVAAPRTVVEVADPA